EPVLLRGRGWPDVDLLPAEVDRGAHLARRAFLVLTLHAEHALVPGCRDVDVLHVDDEMIEGFDGEGHGLQLRNTGMKDGRAAVLEGGEAAGDGAIDGTGIAHQLAMRP